MLQRLAPVFSASRCVTLVTFVAFALALAMGLGLADVSPAQAAATVDPSAIVAMARALVGSPYAYIGDDPNTGFSCIGFVHYVYAQAGVGVPYDLGTAYTTERHVSFTGLRPGDLVFFSNTVWQGLSHVALYAGDGQIIGADNYMTGVEVSRLSDPYWLAHYTGATRPLTGFGTVPTTGPIMPHPVAPPVSAHARVLPRTTSHKTTAPAHEAARQLREGDVLNGQVAAEVYSGPGYAYPRIDRLGAHVQARIAGLQDGWANVAYDVDGTESYGWVDATYLAHCVVSRAPTGSPQR